MNQKLEDLKEVETLKSLCCELVTLAERTNQIITVEIIPPTVDPVEAFHLGEKSVEDLLHSSYTNEAAKAFVAGRLAALRKQNQEPQEPKKL